MNDRVARLLAKLCPKGASHGVGGGAEWDALEVAALMAGCPHPAYLTILAKYTEDAKAQRELVGLLVATIRGKARALDLSHAIGLQEAVRLSGEIAYLQFMDGYRCNHCEGKGEIWTKGGPKTCANCRGSARGFFSNEFKARYMHLKKLGRWSEVIDEGERLLNDWELEGGMHLIRKARIEA